MAKYKYYAVRVGRIPGVYKTWEECKNQTDGVANCDYRGFNSLQEAEQYVSDDLEPKLGVGDEGATLEEINNGIEERINSLSTEEVIAFVDGSFDSKEEKAGFGVVLISYGKQRDVLYRAFTKDLGAEFIAMRNVAAEIEGVKEAVNWAIKYGKKRITIYYDYEGLEAWAKGSWKAKKEITKNYVSFLSEKKCEIEIEFIKVPAHSGVKLNEDADSLAKYALLAKGYKTYDNGSVYFVGFSVDDWKAIIDCVNDENQSLLDKEAELINIAETHIVKRTKLVISQVSNRLVINCYPGHKSYVQGKQSVLFQKVIATAIELQKSGQSVVEILNNYHALTIKKEEVDLKFEQLLPHYRGKTNDKNYSNLLSSVYNTMLTGYMPDYTCLVTPVFRAYEHYLHAILGMKMGLQTEDDKGRNNFAYFDKDCTGAYVCNSSEKSKLSMQQNDYLNRLYTKYHGIRHRYSHWSADDADVAVIDDIKTAREYLVEGLHLIDEYYMVF